MSVFDNASDDAPTNYLEALVGEGKKFQDQEALARGKWEADRHSARLESELAEAREKIQEAKTVEDLLAKIQANQSQRPSEPVAHQPAEPAALAPQDVQELIRQEVSKAEALKSATSNISQVADKLTEHFGSESAANQAVKAKANELGVPLEWLQDAAARSPKAFFTTMGLDLTATPSAPGPTHGDVNPRALERNSTSVKVGTYKYYEEIRKSDPRLWQKLQPQIHKEALEKGADFFN